MVDEKGIDSHLQFEYQDDSPYVSLVWRGGGWEGALNGCHTGRDFHLGMENLWSDTERRGPGIEEGTVNRRVKTAKMERPARRTERRLEESRGTGRPNRTCCFGMVG